MVKSPAGAAKKQHVFEHILQLRCSLLLDLFHADIQQNH